MIAAMRREVASKAAFGAENESLSVTNASNWKLEWRDSFTQLTALMEFLQLDVRLFSDALALDAASTFPLRVPMSFALRMTKCDPHDPLLAQILPRMAERLIAVNFVSDPVNDLQHSPSMGVIHKYRSRALLIASLVLYGMNEFLGRQMITPLQQKGIDVERLRVDTAGAF